MRFSRSGLTSRTIAAAIAAIVILASATIVIAYESQITPTQTTSSSSKSSTSSSSSTATATSTSISSSVTDGLRLNATIDPTIVDQGSNLTVTAEVSNTLPTDVNVNATSMTNPAYGPCQQDFATGIYVYEGSYTSANVSSAKELLLYNPSLIYTCPRVFTFHYSFYPESDVATVQTIGAPGNTTGPISEVSTINGYWTGSGQDYTLQSFPPGTYTIEVFDAWGQTTIGHFQVLAQTGTTSSSLEIPVASASTSNASLGLSLQLQLSVSSSGNLTIGLSAFNLLNSTNRVAYANNWAYSSGGLTENDGCAFPASLAFGIFSGNYSLSDYQTANPLPLYNTNVQFSCTLTFVSTTFTPLGNESVGQSTSGYWTGGVDASKPASFMTFPPGIYTVIGVDEWGQIVLLHFSVVREGATTTTSFECVISGQPGGIYVRVLSDSDQTPVAGADVRATNVPAYCNSTPANQQTTVNFTTGSGTEWYSLNSENNAGYSFVVIYLGQAYAFTASLRPVSLTCATLYVPSGITNVTISEFQETC